MLLFASIVYYTTIYLGIAIYILGFSGSLLNIRILYSNRTNPCTFLLIYTSIVDCFVLNIGLLPRILAVGFGIDPTLSNLIWCKIRTYGLRISTVISLYSICLMSVERFFVSCRTVRWRQLSNLSFIRWATFIVTFLIVIEGLPFFILTQILRTSSSASCTPMYNAIFATYASFFSIPILFGVLPLFILIAMGLLIYSKLHSRAHLRKAQQALTLIILFRIVLVMVSCGPYTSYFVYSAITLLSVSVKSPNRIAIENLLISLISVFLYITYSSSFFVYYFTSPSYRKQFMELFIRPRRRNLVRPVPATVARLVQTNLPIAINKQEENGTVQQVETIKKCIPEIGQV